MSEKQLGTWEGGRKEGRGGKKETDLTITITRNYNKITMNYNFDITTNDNKM
jgi:hypothetical protein